MDELDLWLSGGKRLKYKDYFDCLYDSYRDQKPLSIVNSIKQKYKRTIDDAWWSSAHAKIEAVMSAMSTMLANKESNAEKLLQECGIITP